MELSFVINAVKRYWWAVVACVLLGTMAGVQLRGDQTTSFKSTAMLLISAPTNSITEAFSAGADRYLLGQLSVLQSNALAVRVAEEVGGIDAEAVQEQVLISQVMSTDVVAIEASAATPEIAEALATSYVEQYTALMQGQLDLAQNPQLQQLRSTVGAVRERLDEIDAEISAVMAPFLDAGSDSIPTLDQIAPELSTSRQILLQQYDRVSFALDQAQLNSQVRLATQTVQSASEAALVVEGGGTKKLAAGVITGLMLGAVVASFLASQSNKALDEQQVAEVLGAEVVGELPRVRALARNRRAAAEALPAKLAPFIDMLNVRAEAHARIGQAFTVAVVGAERSSGTTTLAAAMANRYAATGSQVLLVDADPRDSELTRLFAAAAPGIPALLAGVGASADGSARRPASSARLAPFSPTAQPGLNVVGIGDKSSVAALRRQNVPELIDAAIRHAHVVVFDGGPLLDAASTVQLANLVDAVVLAVPNRKLLTRSLNTLVAQLQHRQGDLLPVLVAVGKRARGSSRRSAERPLQRSFGLAGQPDIEQIPAPDVVAVGRR
jgi:Mrp family chromosome partitioning ATPase